MFDNNRKLLRILFVLDRFPYPATDGMKTKVYNLLKQLSKKHELFLLSFYKTSSEIQQENIAHIKEYCQIVGLVPCKPRKRLIARILLEGIRKEPSFCDEFKSPQFENILSEFVKQNKVDVAHFDLYSLAQYVSVLNDALPAVISPSDCLSADPKERFSNLPKENVIIRICRFPQRLKIRNWEKNTYIKFQKCHVVSDDSKIYLLRLNQQIDVEMISIGVDTDFFKPLELVQDYPSVAYVGNMDGANSQYAIWFIDHVLPNLRTVLPNIKLFIVGKGPQEGLVKRALQDKRIVVTGFVEDVRPYIHKATLFVSIINSHPGMLTKVLEAMAMEKAVVGTRSSFSGIRGCIHGENMIAVDNAEEFANWVIRLIKDRELREKIGKNARLLVKNSYTWQGTARRLEILYQQAILKFYKLKNNGGI